MSGILSSSGTRVPVWLRLVCYRPVGSVRNEVTKQDLICELDAYVAYLYGPDESDLAVIYETFHEGTDYSERPGLRVNSRSLRPRPPVHPPGRCRRAGHPRGSCTTQ